MNTAKWFGTLCVILAAVSRAFEYHSLDIILSIVGAAVWGIVSIKMKDNALLTVNAFIVAILLYGAIANI
jgi:hypothetical protein